MCYAAISFTGESLDHGKHLLVNNYTNTTFAIYKYIYILIKKCCKIILTKIPIDINVIFFAMVFAVFEQNKNI